MPAEARKAARFSLADRNFTMTAFRPCCSDAAHAGHIRNGIPGNLSMLMTELLNVPDPLACLTYGTEAAR